MSAFKKHFLAYLIHPNGYDCKVPGLTIQNMDEKVDLSNEEVEDLFYRTATFYVHILKKPLPPNNKEDKEVPYAKDSIMQWMSAQLAYFKVRPDTKDRLGQMISAGTSNSFVPNWLPCVRNRMERSYNQKYVVNADNSDDEDDPSEALYQVLLGPHCNQFLRYEAVPGSFEQNAENRFVLILQYNNCARGGETRHITWTGKGSNGAASKLLRQNYR